MPAIDVSAVVTLVTSQLGSVVAVGVACLGVKVALEAHKWVRRAMGAGGGSSSGGGQAEAVASSASASYQEMYLERLAERLEFENASEGGAYEPRSEAQWAEYIAEGQESNG